MYAYVFGRLTASLAAAMNVLASGRSRSGSSFSRASSRVSNTGPVLVVAHNTSINSLASQTNDHTQMSMECFKRGSLHKHSDVRRVFTCGSLVAVYLVGPFNGLITCPTNARNNTRASSWTTGQHCARGAAEEGQPSSSAFIEHVHQEFPFLIGHRPTTPSSPILILSARYITCDIEHRLEEEGS